MGDNASVNSYSEARTCRFPVDEGLGRCSELEVMKLPFVTPNVVSSFTRKEPQMLCCIFRAAWGLVLRSYLVTNEVCFGTLSSIDGAADILLGGSDSHGSLSLCRLSLAENISVHTVLEQSRNDYLNHSWHLELQKLSNETQNTVDFNTCVMVGTGHVSLERLQSAKKLQLIDLIIQVVLPVEGMEVSLLYRRNKMSSWKANNVIQSFYAALQGILMNSSAKISDLHVFGSYDQELLNTWMAASLAPVVDCLHSAISRRAATQPYAPAVCSWEVEWSYVELENLSTIVASQLSKLGVQAEVLVPLLFEKSAWTIVAMLAVIKAGGAFVALDSQQPVPRLLAIIKQLASPILVISAQQAHRISELGFTERTSLIVSHATTGIRSHIDVEYECSTNSKSPAYVIFTSGSTGEPKGVIIEHEAICTSCDAQSLAFSLQQDSRMLQFSSYAFDACIGEIFTTLFAGGCVCVPSDEERNDVAAVTQALRANFVKLTPTLLNLLQPSDVPDVQTILSVGEKMTTSIRDKWARNVKLLSGYGPAECSVDASAAHITWDTPADNIGSALKSCRLWVVDPIDPKQLASVGCPGELYIEGPILARGYLHDEPRTQAAFFENLPWIPRESSGRPRRVYKTGDFVQHNQDGSLKFLGRRDLQVKIHGQRIELGEIEQQLRLNLPSYQTVAVELAKLASNPEELVLVGFISNNNNDSCIMVHKDNEKLLLPMTGLLRHELITAYSSLLEALPRHMVPAIFAPLRRMPLNPSGKLDRNALRQIACSLTVEEATLFPSPMAPQTSVVIGMEASLQALWARVLRVSPTIIGRDSNFFLLGGNSMSVIRLLAAAREQNIIIRAADIFQFPILCALAVHMVLAAPSVFNGMAEQVEDVPNSLLASLPKLVLLNAENVENIIPITDVQKLLLFYNHLQQGSGFMRISFTFDGAVDVGELQTACQSTIAEHQILRTVFVSNGENLLQVVLRDCPISFRQLSHEAWKNDVQAGDCIARLECFGAPIVHLVALKSDMEPTCFMLQFSHVQYDAFSVPLLVKSIHSFYQGSVSQTAPKFSNFVTATHLDQAPSELYWKTLLKGSELTELRTQSSAQYAFSQYRLKIQLIPFVSMNDHGITTPSIIKAAWSIVFSQVTGQDDIVFGEVVAGRNAQVSGIDQIIGPCFDIIPIRIRPEPRTCMDLLREVEEQHISGIPHENVGILAIIERCTSWPKWGRLSTVVNYRSSMDSTPRELSFGEFTANISITEKIASFADIVLDTAAGKNGIYINLAYNDEILSSPDAKKILTYLCNTVDFLINSPTSSLSSWRKLDGEVQILSAPATEPRKLNPSTVDMASADVNECADSITKVWERLQLLRFRSDGSERPFYESRNHFETALVLRDLYHQLGADLTLEDIMDYPTLDEHVMLVTNGRLRTVQTEKPGLGI